MAKTDDPSSIRADMKERVMENMNEHEINSNPEQEQIQGNAIQHEFQAKIHTR